MLDPFSPDRLSRKDVQRLLAVAWKEVEAESARPQHRSDLNKAHRDYAMVLLALNAGLRPAEIADMKVGDFHFGNDGTYVEVRTLGGRPGRDDRLDRLDLQPQVALKLLDWTSSLDAAAPMFPSERMDRAGKRKGMSTRGVWDAIKRLMSKAGLEELSAEDLRAYYLRVEIETQKQLGKFDLAFLAQRARHKSEAQIAKLMELFHKKASLGEHMSERPLDT